MTDHHAEWSARLSAYLDDELPPADRAALETHLAGCVHCRSALGELRAIVTAAPLYAGEAPNRDLWPAVAVGIEQSRSVRFPSARVGPSVRRFSLAQMLAAAATVAVVVGGSVWMALRPGASGGPGVSVVANAPSGDPTVRLAVSPRADSAYDGAVADLERVLREGRSRLDTATVRVIEQNLQIIDRAIAEARAAIAADPANAYLNGQMAANMRRKLDLLRRAASAISES